jgi:hypothetical protein
VEGQLSVVTAVLGEARFLTDTDMFYQGPGPIGSCALLLVGVYFIGLTTFP